MIDKNIEEYLNIIKHELDMLNDGKFTGNVDFKVNFKDGNIGNVNVSLNKSVKI